MTRSTSRKGRRRAISGTSKTFPISRRTPCSQSTYSAIYVTWLSWPSSLRYAFESRHRRSPLRLLLAGRESSVVSALLHGGSKLLRKGASIRYLSSRTSPGMSSKSLSSKPKDLKISRGATSILKYKSMNMRLRHTRTLCSRSGSSRRHYWRACLIFLGACEETGS